MIDDWKACLELHTTSAQASIRNQQSSIANRQ
jgi:hypothetical protein